MVKNRSVAPYFHPNSIGQNWVACWRNGVFPYLQEEAAAQVSSHFLLHWNPLAHSRPSLFIEWITNEEHVELGFVGDSETPSHTIRERGKHVEPVGFHWWALSPGRSLLSSMAAPQTFCRPKLNWFILFPTLLCALLVSTLYHSYTIPVCQRACPVRWRKEGRGEFACYTSCMELEVFDS